MGALLSGTTLAPIMAIVMIFEMTMDAALFFPLILSAFVSRHIAAAIRPLSVYGKGMDDFFGEGLRHLKIQDVMTPIDRSLRPYDTLRDILFNHWWHGPSDLWVASEEGLYLGRFSLLRLAENSDLVNKEAWVKDYLREDFALNRLTPLRDVGPHLHNLPDFRYPVTDGEGRLCGEIDSRELKRIVLGS